MVFLRILAFFGFFCFVFLGASYFSPGPYYSFFTDLSLYQDKFLPLMDGYFRSAGEGDKYSGRLMNGVGDLQFRPQNEFVFFPLRSGQRFFGKTLVMSGVDGEGMIQLSNESKLEFGPNTTVVIDQPETDLNANLIASVRVLDGAVKAIATRKKTVNLYSPSGKKQVVQEKPIMVVSSRQSVDPRSTIRVPRREYIGPEKTEGLQKLRQELAEQVRLDRQKQALKITELSRNPAQERVAALVVREEDLERAQAAMLQNKIFESSKTLDQGAGPLKGGQAFNGQALSVEQKPPTPKKAKEKPKPRPENKMKAYSPKGDLTSAVRNAKKGNLYFARRKFASALTREGHDSAGFRGGTEVALNSVLSGYVNSGNCKIAVETVANVKKQYSKDDYAQSWVRNWQKKLAARCD